MPPLNARAARLPKSETDAPSITGRKLSLADISTAGQSVPQRWGVYAPGGWGKCLGRGTPVIMYDGTVRPVETIHNGELLMGPDSQPRVVSGAHSGRGPLFRVKPVKGLPFICNESHVLSLVGYPAGPNRPLSNVSVGDYLQMAPSRRRELVAWRTPGIDWPAQNDLPLPPYMLGIWLGDGTATKTDITTPEPEIVEYLEQFVKCYDGIQVKAGAVAGTATTYAMTRKQGGVGVPNEIIGALKALNVFDNKHIPWAYKVNSRENRLQLLAGLIDTDGYYNNGCYDFVQKQKSIAEDVVFIARSLGLAANITECRKGCMHKGEMRVGTYHRVTLSGNTNMIPSKLPRKMARVRQQRKDALVTGITVEPIGDGEFFGFEVDQDHLFLLGDFTVTHNSSLGAKFPKPIFLMTSGETGLISLIDNKQLPETPHFPEIKTFPDLQAAVSLLLSEAHDYKTLVLDTANGAERLLHEYVCQRDYQGDWGDRGFMSYQKGYEVALADWRLLLNDLDRLREDKGMTILFLFHSGIKTFKNPSGPDYDKYIPEMKPQTWSLTKGWLDGVLFGSFEVTVETGKRVDSTKKGKANEVSTRVFYTNPENPTYDAKNRHGLPEVIEAGDSAEEAFKNLRQAIVDAKAEKKAEVAA